MSRFPSKEWCERALTLLNADPESVAAGAGWKGDLGAVVEPEPGKLAKPFTVYTSPKQGRIESFQVLPDPDDLEELDPVYLIRAPYSVWKQLIRGTLDPIAALVERRLQLKGDVQQILERMKYRGVADRVLAKLNTQFVDDP